MASTAAWLIVSGFVFLVLGFVLRTVMMMRSSDAAHPTASALHGRELLRQYRRHFPRSPTPLLARWNLSAEAIDRSRTNPPGLPKA